MQPFSVFELLYGGARGGGKTDAGQVWMTDHVAHPRFRGLVIRKNANDLTDWIDRARRMFSGLRAHFAGNPMVISFPSGAKIYCGHLQDDNAYTKYQGQEYQRILIEELTQIPNEKRYIDLISSCRSTVPDIKPQVFLTTNPGGIGHGWVKERFVDAGPPNTIFMSKSGRKAMFIPSTIDDNPKLLENDPDYVKLLDSYKDTDPDRYKAWRLGDWNVFAGQVFKEFRTAVHVRRYVPDTVLKMSTKVIGYDWGYNDMGCAIWLAITPEDRFGVKHIFAYREIYQNETTPEEWAKAVMKYVQFEPIKYMVLPHDCFAHKTNDRSIADVFQAAGIPIIAAKSLAKGARLNRLAITHDMFSISPNGRPYMQFTEDCKDLIRTLPSLPYDEHAKEDVDTHAEDHAYDALTYALMVITNGRSWIVDPKVAQSKRTGYLANAKGELEGFNIDLAAAIKSNNQPEGDWRH